MLPNNLPFEKKEGGSYEPLPEDMYQVELLDITLQEKPSYNDKTKMEQVMSFQFVVLDGELRGRSIWKNFVPTYLYIGKNGKNALYQITEAIIKRFLSQEEEATFGSDTLNKMIGYQCRIVVKNKAGKDGKSFSNIDSFLPAKEHLTSLTSEERKKAAVKEKNDGIVNEATALLGGTLIEELPTIHIDDEVRVEDIPFA